MNESLLDYAPYARHDIKHARAGSLLIVHDINANCHISAELEKVFQKLLPLSAAIETPYDYNKTSKTSLDTQIALKHQTGI